MNIKKIYVLFIILGALLIVALYFLSPKGPVSVDSGYHIVMGTFARVSVIAANHNTAYRCISAAFIEIYKVDNLMSYFKSNSEISLVNREGFRRAIKVSDPTYEVIKRSVEISKLTDGAFDITVGPLVELFRTAQKTEVAPSEEEIAKAKAKAGFEKLVLDDPNRTVRFTVEGMRLDLGGIGKGFAVDKAIEAAQKAGALGAMVDIGGHIRCFGAAPQGKDSSSRRRPSTERDWLIGLQDPKAVKNPGFHVPGTTGANILLTLKLKDGAAVTSGDYQQFVVIKDKRYSHILNPQTGTSAEGLSSVTIIADNATDADALATAISVMGAEKGLALIGKLPNTEAILVTSQPEYKIIKTSGVEKYIK
jgi:thiamine biosynthesis lipoprotein